MLQQVSLYKRPNSTGKAKIDKNQPENERLKIKSHQ